MYISIYIYIIHNTFDMRDIQPSYDIFIGLSEMGYAMVYRYTLQMAHLMGHRHHIFIQWDIIGYDCTFCNPFKSPFDGLLD